MRRITTSDHGGCAQDLKNAGMRLIVSPEQISAIPAMARWIKAGEPFTPIDTQDNLEVACADSRALLAPPRAPRLCDLCVIFFRSP